MFYTNEFNGVMKHYYCFITQKEQYANNTVKLSLALDVFQTWFFDMKLHACFVERMHVNDDTIGANTYPENLETGDLITYGRKSVNGFAGDVCYLLAYADESQLGTQIGKLFSGYTFVVYKQSDYTQLINKITSLCNAGKGDTIGYIAMYPYNILYQIFGSITSGSVLNELTQQQAYYERDIQLNVASFSNATFDGYTPKNNKLFTYPYTMFSITTPSGSNVVLKPELFYGIKKLDDFSDGTMDFRITGTIGQNPKFEITPLYYNNLDFAIEDSATLEGYGLCSWQNDNYANWFAQNQNSIHAQSVNATASYNTATTIANNNYDINKMSNIVNTTSNAISSITSLLTGNIAGAIAGGINTAANMYVSNKKLNSDLNNSLLSNNTNYQNNIRSLMASVKDASVMPNTCKGDTSTCGLDLSRGTNTFYITRNGIKEEFARKIDGYFTMYGYQVNLPCTYPRTNTRKYFNYIKTQECNVTGNVPTDDRKAIQELYNTGFTVWHDYFKMYDYTVDNQII